ncbi:MAG: hypothetical protein WCG15_10030 [Actinomycetes bacterium]
MPLPISRRDALRSFAGAAALATLTRPTLGAEEKNPAPGATALTPIRHSVCKWCYSKIPLDDFAKVAKDIGLESVELLDPKDWPTVQKYGLTCALANGTMSIPSGFNRLENHAKYVPTMIERINACADAGIDFVSLPAVNLYLQARGIPADVATQLVVRGFFADVISRLGLPEWELHLLGAIDNELGFQAGGFLEDGDE